VSQLHDHCRKMQPPGRERAPAAERSSAWRRSRSARPVATSRCFSASAVRRAASSASTAGPPAALAWPAPPAACGSVPSAAAGCPGAPAASPRWAAAELGLVPSAPPAHAVLRVTAAELFGSNRYRQQGTGAPPGSSACADVARSSLVTMSCTRGESSGPNAAHTAGAALGMSQAAWPRSTAIKGRLNARRGASMLANAHIGPGA